MSSTVHDLRYGFGKNWADYIRKHFSDEIVDRSKAHIGGFLRLESLRGLTFLDIGCGSGLHSLAAHRMGAERVISFDYDVESIATAQRLRQYEGNPGNWVIFQGSVLDGDFMEKLPKVDIVYSWGVLHHTGDMWSAVRNAALPMKPEGVYYIALYSSDMYIDPSPQYWIKLKRDYNVAGPLRKRIMEWQYVLRFDVAPALRRGRLPTLSKQDSRGMTYWTDLRDWLGGYPMDFASLQETQQFCKGELGLDLVSVKTGEGNTEYLFCRLASNAQWRSTVEQRTMTPLNRPFAPYGGAAYGSELPGYKDHADSQETPRRSELMVYEDGRMLGLAHSSHADIITHGKGRFSHWGTAIYFSASDNSDPNVNGRSYEFCKML